MTPRPCGWEGSEVSVSGSLSQRRRCASAPLAYSGTARGAGISRRLLVARSSGCPRSRGSAGSRGSNDQRAAVSSAPWSALGPMHEFGERKRARVFRLALAHLAEALPGKVRPKAFGPRRDNFSIVLIQPCWNWVSGPNWRAKLPSGQCGPIGEDRDHPRFRIWVGSQISIGAALGPLTSGAALFEDC